MTQIKYRTTKIPDYYFRQIENYLEKTDRYVSVSEFLREAINAMFNKEALAQNYGFLLLKDLVFTKARLMQIHEEILKHTTVDSSAVLRQTFEQLIENSIDADLYTFLAKFFYNFGKYHPFADANKRTAFVAADTFLRLNNIKLNLSAKKASETKDEVFLWQTSIQQKEIKKISEFLASKTVPHAGSMDFEKELKGSIEDNMLLLNKLSR